MNFPTILKLKLIYMYYVIISCSFLKLTFSVYYLNGLNPFKQTSPFGIKKPHTLPLDNLSASLQNCKSSTLRATGFYYYHIEKYVSYHFIKTTEKKLQTNEAQNCIFHVTGVNPFGGNSVSENWWVPWFLSQVRSRDGKKLMCQLSQVLKLTEQ